MNKGNLFIISGPSGSGKDTVLAEVFKTRKDLYFSISSENCFQSMVPVPIA